jgi:prophage regulatory protein
MRFLSFDQLKPEKGISYSRRHLRRKEIDGTFPKSVAISEGRIAWVEAEVDAWIGDKIKARDDGTAARLPHRGIAAREAAPPVPKVAPTRSRRARERDPPNIGSS